MRPSLGAPARLTPGPLVLVAVCLGSGILAGLRFGSLGGIRTSLSITLVAGSLGWLHARARPARGATSRKQKRTVAGFLLAATFAAGAASGGVAGLEADRSCLARLDDGATVEATGLLASPLVAAPAPGQGAASSATFVRVDILDAELATRAGECSVPRLLALLKWPKHAHPAGSIVRIRGRWSAHARPGAWPKRPERRGYTRVREAAYAATGTSLDGAGSVGTTPEGRVARLGLLQRVRAAGIRRIESRLPADVSPTAVAILLAERGRLDPATSRSFAHAGLAHLLAISGLHVGILAAVATAVAGIFVVGAGRHFAAASLVLIYVFVIGAPPAAVRAALLFLGYAASRARGSPARVTDLLALAATLALLADPLTLLEPGFQMSFAGFSGLLLGGRIAHRLAPGEGDSGAGARRRARRSVRWLVRAIGASAGAFALTAPISAWHFQRAAPVSVFSSFVGSPVVALALLALAGVLLLPGPAADTLAAAATVLLRSLEALVETFSAVPIGHVLVGRPGPIEWLVVLTGWLALLLFSAGRSIWRAASYAGLALCLAAVSPAIRLWQGAGRTLLCTLDVGQGDAAVLRTRRGHWLAVDAGPSFGETNAGVRVVLPFLLSNGARALDLFVLTHPDLDHLGGATALLERLPVKRVLDAALPVPAERYEEYLSAVATEGSKWLVGRPGARIALDEIEILVLGPLAPSRGDSARGALAGGRPIRANEASLSLRIMVDGGFSYVNAGDAPAAEERRMLASWSPDTLRADLLKVSHHGSKTSSDVSWLKALAPRLAIISVGSANRYGHPHPLALARLDSAGLGEVWRTDRDGTVCVSVDSAGQWRLEDV